MDSIKNCIELYVKSCEFAIAQEFKKEIRDINVLEIAAYLKNVMSESTSSEYEILCKIQPFYESMRAMVRCYIHNGLNDEQKQNKEYFLKTVMFLDKMFKNN